MNKNLKQKKKLFSLKNKILDLLYPEHLKCIFCGDELNTRSNNDTCEECLLKLTFIKNFCEKCGSPLKNKTTICESCKLNNNSFEMARSVFEYKNEALNLVYKLKYNNKKYLAKPIAKYIAELYLSNNINADYVTFVPSTKQKLKQRGFNQAEEIAKHFCKNTHLTLLNCVDKTIDRPSQTTLDYKSRRENVKDTFAIKTEQINKIKGKTFVIIDDVITTGATSSEISKTLLNAGASKCYVFTFAHTSLEDDLLIPEYERTNF